MRLIAGSNAPHRTSEADLARMERHDHAVEVRFPGPDGLDRGSRCGSITSPTRALERPGAEVAPFVTVGYRGIRIAEGTVSVDGLRVSFPFAGGVLDPDGFTASIYVAPGRRRPGR